MRFTQAAALLSNFFRRDFFRRDFFQRSIAIFALLILPFIAGCARSGMYDATVPVSAPVRLRVANQNGYLNIVGVPNLSAVRVHCDFKVKGWPWQLERQAQALASHPPIATEPDGTIRIGNDPPRWPDAEFGYVVEVPLSTSLHIATWSSDITVFNVKGPAVFSTDWGHVTARDIGGDVRVNAGKRTVNLREIAGNANITTSSAWTILNYVRGTSQVDTHSGAVIVDHPGAAVDIASVDGNIQVAYATENLVIRSDSGTIYVAGAPQPDAFWNISGRTSDVTLELPAISGFQIDAQTVLGHIFNPERMQADPASAPRIFLSSARREAATARIRVRTESGDIEISRSQDRP